MSRSAIFVVVLSLLCIALVLSLPGGVIVSRGEIIAKQLEKQLEIDIPSDFTIVRCGSCGVFFPLSRYAYTIQFEEDSFDQFLSNWSDKYGKRRSWSGTHGKILLRLEIEENRTLFFDHGTLSAR